MRNASVSDISTNILFILFLFTESAYSYYSLILKKAGQFLDDLHVNLLKFAFSIRAYSPTIQMFQQVCKNAKRHGTNVHRAI